MCTSLLSAASTTGTMRSPTSTSIHFWFQTLKEQQILKLTYNFSKWHSPGIQRSEKKPRSASVGLILSMQNKIAISTFTAFTVVIIIIALTQRDIRVNTVFRFFVSIISMRMYVFVHFLPKLAKALQNKVKGPVESAIHSRSCDRGAPLYRYCTVYVQAACASMQGRSHGTHGRVQPGIRKGPPNSARTYPQKGGILEHKNCTKRLPLAWGTPEK